MARRVLEIASGVFPRKPTPPPTPDLEAGQSVAHESVFSRRAHGRQPPPPIGLEGYTEHALLRPTTVDVATSPIRKRGYAVVEIENGICRVSVIPEDRDHSPRQTPLRFRGFSGSTKDHTIAAAWERIVIKGIHVERCYMKGYMDPVDDNVDALVHSMRFLRLIAPSLSWMYVSVGCTPKLHSQCVRSLNRIRFPMLRHAMIRITRYGVDRGAPVIVPPIFSITREKFPALEHVIHQVAFGNKMVRPTDSRLWGDPDFMKWVDLIIEPSISSTDTTLVCDWKEFAKENPWADGMLPGDTPPQVDWVRGHVNRILRIRDN